MGLLGAIANPPKSDDKYVEKSVQLVRGSSFRNDLLQNPYFSKTFANKYRSFHSYFILYKRFGHRRTQQKSSCHEEHEETELIHIKTPVWPT